MFLPGEFHWQRSLTGCMNECIYTLQKSIKNNLKSKWIMNRHFKWKETCQSVQSLSRVRLFVTPWTAACQASLSITNSQSLLKFISTESVMSSNHHLILCRPLLLLPSIFPNIRSFLRLTWPKYLSFSVSPSDEYSGLISFRIVWFELLRNM